MSNKFDYDAIIIGAGISGLVCGCYLAKSGMKTLIVEKNAKPGGYCTSFTRGGFNFDACVHSLGSLREGGIIRTILHELELEERLEIKRYDPSDIIVTPDFKIHFWNSLDKTIQEFQNYFPNESKHIRTFFEYAYNCEGNAFVPLRSITFQTLLDRYFRDKKLKATLSLPVLGNSGLPSSKVSALTGTLIYKEFIFDGGYYPHESIQSLADILVKRFKEFGGQIKLSSLVRRIRVRDEKVEGIEVDNMDFISSRYLVSNVDATQTFLNLIGKEHVREEMKDNLKSLEPSLSMLILYLGMKEDFSEKCNLRSNINLWYLPQYDIDRMYYPAIAGDIDNLDWFLFRLLTNQRGAIMLVNAPFKDEKYWNLNKKRLVDLFIKKIERIIPDLSLFVEYKDAATPHTLYKWTLNYKGAAYGWAGIPSQLAIQGFTQRTNFKNLYLTGHWTTLAQGISGAAYLGRNASNKIITKAS